MVRSHQTSDVQLHIGESLDSGFDAEPVIGPAIGRTRWHRPGMTAWVFFLATTKHVPGSFAGTKGRDMLCSPSAAADFHSPAACWGERYVAWIDTHHHRDHLPLGRLQRPVRRPLLRHGPFP